MKKIIFIAWLFLSFLLMSCGNQTIKTYNNTIVSSYNNLDEISKNLIINIEKYVGKTDKTAEFKKIIMGNREQMIGFRKPIDDLLPIKDSGLRDDALDLFSEYETLLLTLNLNAEKITATPTPDNTIMDLILEKLQKIQDSETILIETQRRFAEANNAQLR